MMENASCWHHLVSWWEHRDDTHVLIIFYEDLRADLKGSIEVIARFMGYQVGGTGDKETLDWRLLV